MAFQFGVVGAFGFEVVQIFQEQQPGRLLGIIQLGGHALVVAQGLVDVVEGVFEHAWVSARCVRSKAASLPARIACDDA